MKEVSDAKYHEPGFRPAARRSVGSGNSFGRYGEVYARLLEKGETLLQHARSGDRPQMNALIDEMIVLAADLPGTGPVDMTKD